MLPDMSDVLDEWGQPVTFKALTRTTVDFKPVVSVAARPAEAVIQPTDAKTLVAAQIDTAVAHWTFHSPSKFEEGEFIEHEGVNYRVVRMMAWGDYGYWEGVGELVRGNIEDLAP